MKLPFLILGICAFLASFSGPVSALERDNFLIGFGVEGSHIEDENIIGDDDRNSGFGMNFHIGGSLTPEWALMYLNDFHVGVGEIANVDYTLSQYFGGAVAQYSMNRVHLRAGLGLALTRVEVEYLGIRDDDDRTGFGVYLAPAFEIIQGDQFVMDAHLKFIPQFYSSDNGGFAYQVGAGLGFSWY